jgi:hypothetical protein
VAVEGLLPDPHHQPRVFRDVQGSGREDRQLPGLSLGRVVAINRPALALLPGEHRGRGPVFLLVVGLGPDEFDRHRIAPLGRLDLDLDL